MAKRTKKATKHTKDATDWVSGLVSRLETSANGNVEVEIGGQKIVAELGKDFVKFFKDNRVMLLKIGQQTFAHFLLLLHDKKKQQAFNLLVSKMDADDIIARLNANADSLHHANDLRDQFVASLKKFAKTYLLPLTIKVLIKLIIP